jgi:methylthioribose-1-phosphate isomerase
MQLKDMTRKTALQIRQVIKADREMLLQAATEIEPHRRNLEWQRYNYINYSTADLRAELLDKLLGTFGVEYLFKGSDGLRGDPESMHDSPILTYCNTGDTYATTLLKYHGRWQVGNWGSIAEKYL